MNPEIVFDTNLYLSFKPAGPASQYFVISMHQTSFDALGPVNWPKDFFKDHEKALKNQLKFNKVCSDIAQNILELDKTTIKTVNRVLDQQLSKAARRNVSLEEVNTAVLEFMDFKDPKSPSRSLRERRENLQKRKFELAQKESKKRRL